MEKERIMFEFLCPLIFGTLDAIFGLLESIGLGSFVSNVAPGVYNFWDNLIDC
jgi:hypothetical protein